jgi:hypothetical protein
MLASIFVVLAISASTFANVFMTSPTASSTFVGGQKSTVTWQDDGSAPSLQDFGAAKVSIYVGNSIQQTPLQTIAETVDVSKTNSVDFTPDPSIGPNGKNYFVRIESLGLKDAKQPQFPALAFSAIFTMSGMSGNFNSSVQAQIDGQSTAPIGGLTTASAGATSAGAATTTGAASASNKPSSSSSGSAAKSTSSTSSKTGGANKLTGAGAAGFIGVAVALLVGPFF